MEKFPEFQRKEIFLLFLQNIECTKVNTAKKLYFNKSTLAILERKKSRRCAISRPKIR